MKSSGLILSCRRRRNEIDQPRARMEIGNKPCSCSLCRTSSVFCPSSTTLTTSPEGLAYLHVNSILGEKVGLLTYPVYNLNSGRHFEIKQRRPEADIGLDITED